jgi:hypothetical protein
MLPVGARDRGEALLDLWERGLGREGSLQADAMLSAQPDAAMLTLGERTRALLQLHTTLFGANVDLVSHCPSCEAIAQFTVDCDALLRQLPASRDAAAHRLELDDIAIEFRLPTAADVAAASDQPTSDAFARHVLERCVSGCTRSGSPVSVDDVPAHVWDAVSQRMEALDPGAIVSFAVDCPECATHWDAPLDASQLLWQQVRTSAERLILDIDALARAYGWTEREVLSLSPARRAAYLQIVTG